VTRVEFENATLADAVKKVASVAPTSAGQAFDKAAGIIMELAPGTASPVILRATNLEVYYMMWVDSISVEGEAVTWRLPSKLFSSLVASLPIGSGSNVVLEDKPTPGGYSQVHLQSGRTKARFSLMDSSYYPEWGAFDPDNLSAAIDLGGRLSQVEWATQKDKTTTYGGVRIDGEVAMATDRYRFVKVPLKIPDFTAPVTFPAELVAQILKQTGEAHIGMNGQQLFIMPDEYSQVRCAVYGEKYPDASYLDTIEYEQSIRLKKAHFLEVLGRVAQFAGAERFPMLQLFFGKGAVAVMMQNDEVGLAGDSIDLTGQCDHPRIEVRFTPKNLMEAITQAPSDEVIIHYTTRDDRISRTPIKIDGGSGYEAWVMPRKEMPKGSEES
jgi:DNA polymerase III sliding clamp (beta) subunit (PCNA family)